MGEQKDFEELKVQTKQDFEEEDDDNWYELRVDGKQPGRQSHGVDCQATFGMTRRAPSTIPPRR